MDDKNLDPQTPAENVSAESAKPPAMPEQVSPPAEPAAQLPAAASEPLLVTEPEAAAPSEPLKWESAEAAPAPSGDLPAKVDAVATKPGAQPPADEFTPEQLASAAAFEKAVNEPQPKQPTTVITEQAQPAAAYVPAYQPAPKTNTLAIISLIASILSWVILPVLGSLIGVITALMARNEIKNSSGRETGDGLAIASLLIGGLNLVLACLCACLFLPLMSLPFFIGN